MTAVKQVALALQGGGAHGAFTWGVLDGVLDEIAAGRLSVSLISGSSSGALNGTAMIYGLREGSALPGPQSARGKRMAETAKAKLEQLWEQVARAAFWGGNPFVAAIGMAMGWNIDQSPAAHMMGLAPNADMGISHYLNTVLREVFPQLPAILATPEPGVPSLMVAATDIEACRRQLFVDGAVSPQALKASACVPNGNQSVTIDDRHYWDGGYLGNPPVVPLVDRIRGTACHDVVVVTLSPMQRTGVPRGTHQVVDRLNELSFSASLIHEVNTIETINRLIDSQKLKGGDHYQRVNLHRIHADQEMVELGVYSKEAPSWDFLKHLRQLGQQSFAAQWPQIQACLGKSSSWDIKPLCDGVLAR